MPVGKVQGTWNCPEQCRRHTSVSECGQEREKGYLWGECVFMRERESILLTTCGVRVWSGGGAHTCAQENGV